MMTERRKGDEVDKGISTQIYSKHEQVKAQFVPITQQERKRMMMRMEGKTGRKKLFTQNEKRKTFLFNFHLSLQGIMCMYV